MGNENLCLRILKDMKLNVTKLLRDIKFYVLKLSIYVPKVFCDIKTYVTELSGMCFPNVTSQTSTLVQAECFHITTEPSCWDKEGQFSGSDNKWPVKKTNQNMNISF